jgi:benzoylformate decarboxylase
MTRYGRQAILEQFVADGMQFMFGNPGTVEEGFLDEIDDRTDLHYVLALQEAAAVGIADGYARASGGPALVQLHSGVGLGNGIGMLYQAKRGHSPLVVVAGESGIQYEAMDAQMAVDLVAMARPVTKYATRVTDPASVLRVLRRAVKIAMTPPRGPVFVALPLDVLDAPNYEPVQPSSLLSTAAVPVPHLMEQAAQLLAGAQHPVILCGDGVSAAGAQNELMRVAEQLGADIWGVDYSEVNFDAGHPLFRGLLGHMFGTASTASLEGADAVLVVGTYLFPEVFPSLTSPFDAGVPVVHIDLDGYEIAKNHPVTLGLVADPKPTLAALGAQLDQLLRDTDRRAAEDRIERRARQRAASAGAESDENSVLAAFAAALAAELDENAMIFDEALTSSPTINRLLAPPKPGHWFLTRGGSLGVGIPGAIGMKLAHPDATVVGFTGDGGSMYTIQALATAARHRIGAKFVICNNHSYALLNDNIDRYWKEREIGNHRYPSAFDISCPALGFVDIARGYGIDGVRVESVEQVDAAVKQMLATDEPFLVDLVISPPPATEPTSLINTRKAENR